LDRRLREALQTEIKRIHEELGITFVYVTHDQDEALLLSDRIAVFRDGRIDQVGTAEDLYERPRTRFVAEFVGDSNVLHGVVQPHGQAVRLDDGTEIQTQDCRGADAGQAVTLVVRPERVQLRTAGAAADSYRNVIRGTVAAVRHLGAARKIEVETALRSGILVREPADQPSGVQPGDLVEVCWRSEDCAVICEEPAVPDSGAAGLRAASSMDLIA
jgi:putative spermidine/putrescine transport system ATP-binding protein